jgi:hypothetical protein
MASRISTIIPFFCAFALALKIEKTKAGIFFNPGLRGGNLFSVRW